MNNFDDYLYSMKKLEDHIKNYMKMDCEIYIISQSLPQLEDSPIRKRKRLIQKDKISQCNPKT